MTPTTAGTSRWRLALPWRRAAGDDDAPRSRSALAVSALKSQARVGRWVLSLALLLVLSTLVSALAVYDQASRHDDRHEAGQRGALQAALAGFRQTFAELTASRAKEIAAARTLDPDALAARLEPAAPGGLGHAQAYVIGANHQILAASTGAPTDLPAPIARLAERVAAAPTAGVVTDIVPLDDAPALVAVTALPGEGNAAPRMLATVRRLDPPLLRALEDTVGVKALSSDAEASGDGRVVQSVLGEGGRIAGWLSYERDRPMTSLLMQLSPFLTLIAAGLVGFTRMAVRQMGRQTRELAASEANVWRLAHEDPLTGLANHRKMLDVLERALAERSGDQVVSFAYLDLDGFKEINDALGHHGGDALLAAVAQRLRGAVPAEAICGRFGGDEFAIVLTAASPAEGLALARTVLAAVNKPYRVDGRVIEIGASIGLAQAPRDAQHRDDLSHRADLALREAKRKGRGLLVEFVPALDSRFEEERFFKRELQKAIAGDRMSVHYQPIVAADGSRIVGVEALLRWTHPARGEIPPAVFIPIAEQTGLMDELGAFVLRRALGDARRWPDLYVAVNLSPVQVRGKSIVERVAAAVTHAAIEPARVVLEITEGVLMENPEEAKARLEDLRALGLRIALDDFGSGYSSLSYLQRFPFDKLKIDRGFVQTIGGAGNGGVIVQAIVALGRALGVSVLVEGVETEEQRVLLRLAGCDEMQGFLFAKAVPREAIDRIWAEANLQPAGTRHALRASA